MSKRTKILIIEDEANIRLALEYNLRLDGFEVHLAQDGPTGLKMVEKIKPELVLLDWMMPQMDGLEVLSELKHNDKTEDIVVFMLTAKGTIGDMDRAFAIGADDYITKPFDPKRLGQNIANKLGKCRKAKTH